MMPPPVATVAVVIRTRNRGLLLDRALADVLSQTYRDWVAVVINDGGDPEPVNRLVSRHRTDGRFTVLHNPASVGMEAAANRAIRASESTYIAIHDDDDEWHKDFLARTIAHLRGLPPGSRERGVAVRTALVHERITHDGRIETLSQDIFEPSVTAITLLDALTSNRIIPISLLYRRDVHDTIGYYDENLTAVGDWDFYLRFLAHHNIGFLDGDPLAFWNQRPESTDDLGNSVIRGRDDHRRFDLQVRDDYLKEHVRRDGLGPSLHLAATQRRAAEHLDHRLGELTATIHSLTAQSRPTQEVVDELRALRRIIEDLQHQVVRLENDVIDASLISLIRRRYHRAKNTFTRRAP